MAKWPSYSPTRYPEIGVSQTDIGQWRFVTTDSDPPAVVGPFYTSGQEIWNDLERYYRSSWAGGLVSGLREQVARILEPQAWDVDGILGKDSIAYGNRRTSSLRKADKILELISK